MTRATHDAFITNWETPKCAYRMVSQTSSVGAKADFSKIARKLRIAVLVLITVLIHILTSQVSDRKKE